MVNYFFQMKSLDVVIKTPVRYNQKEAKNNLCTFEVFVCRVHIQERSISIMNINIFNIQKFSLHDGPGIRTVVFFKGCPLTCKWCSNPESQSPHPQTLWNSGNAIPCGEAKSIDEIMEEVMQDKDFYEESGGGLTLSGGEVLMQPNGAAALLEEAQKNGLHTAIETCGYAPLSSLQQVAAYTNLILFDLKHHNSEQHLIYTGVSNEPIIQNLEWVASNHNATLVRIPVIPTVNDTLDDAQKFCILLKGMGIKKVNLLLFHQFGTKKYEQLHISYSMKDAKPLYPEDLTNYVSVFKEHALEVIL